MFSRNSSKPTPPNTLASGQAAKGKSTSPSVIGADMRIVGNLNSSGETQIDGNVEGDIHSNVLLVGETAHIKGEITADTIRVHGHINGEIKARSVILAATANVVGNILHDNITIEKGAHLEGHLTRMDEKQVRAHETSRINLVGGVSSPSVPTPTPATATAKS